MHLKHTQWKKQCICVCPSSQSLFRCRLQVSRTFQDGEAFMNNKHIGDRGTLSAVHYHLMENSIGDVGSFIRLHSCLQQTSITYKYLIVL